MGMRQRMHRACRPRQDAWVAGPSQAFCSQMPGLPCSTMPIVEISGLFAHQHPAKLPHSGQKYYLSLYHPVTFSCQSSVLVSTPSAADGWSLNSSAIWAWPCVQHCLFVSTSSAWFKQIWASLLFWTAVLMPGQLPFAVCPRHLREDS